MLAFPLQVRLMALRYRFRQRSMVWTEKRTKVLLEVLGTSFVVIRAEDLFVQYSHLGAMRIVKYFSYEIPYLQSKSL